MRLLLDEFLSPGRVEKLVHALSYVRGWGIRIATVIQSEAQLQAVYGRELAEFFIDNHRARVYYRPPVHPRDLAEAIAKVIGRTTVKQVSYSSAILILAYVKDLRSPKCAISQPLTQQPRPHTLR